MPYRAMSHSRKYPVVSKRSVTQTVLKLNLHSMKVPVWLYVKRRGEAQRGGRTPVLVLYLLADSEVSVHHQLAFIRRFIYHQILLRIHVNPSRGFFFSFYVCFFKKKNLFIVSCPWSSLLHSIFFSLVAVTRGYSLVGAWASHYGGFFCFRAQALGCANFSSCGTWTQQLWRVGSVVVACGLSSCSPRL